VKAGEQAVRDLVEFNGGRESIEAIDQKKCELRAKKEKEEAEKSGDGEEKRRR